MPLREQDDAGGLAAIVDGVIGHQAQYRRPAAGKGFTDPLDLFFSHCASGPAGARLTGARLMRGIGR